MSNSMLSSIVGNPGGAMQAFQSEGNPFWDANQGIREMRIISKDTIIYPNDSEEVKKRKYFERIERARKAFVHIESSFKTIQLSMRAASLIPGVGSKAKQAEPFLKSFGSMIQRIKSDWKYAENVFMAFPKIADRYGCGTQFQTGDKRRPIDPAKMMKDPIFIKMIKG